MKKAIFVLTLVLMTIFVACGSNPEDDKAITAVIHENIDAIQNEDIPAYMATIHEQSPSYANTENMIKQILEQYDLSYEIAEVKVIKNSGTEARATYTQTTRKINGPEFRDNIIKGTHILRKSDGKWKIYSTEIQDIKYLN